jgi:hydrogenase-4 membrane subunit HyfE
MSLRLVLPQSVPMAVRTCVWMDVLDEVVMVSLLTRRLSCCCG